MAAPNFGFSQLSKQTPVWAQWMFRISAIVLTTAAFMIGGDTAINAELRVRILVYLHGATTAIYGLSRLFGINLQQEAPQQPEP